MRRVPFYGLLFIACGSRTGLLYEGNPSEKEGGLDVADVTDVVIRRDANCVPVADGCGATEICGNGADDNCNKQVDEGCTCAPGDVQACFAGPPGRRNIGVCRDGAQVCSQSGAWEACTGGILPRTDVCNGADNLCTGCSQQADCPISCPSPGDVRVPDGIPFSDYKLNGPDFYPGQAKAWAWKIKGGPCDDVSKTQSFDLINPKNSVATFKPTLSGDYEVTMNVITVQNTPLTCTWIVHIAGPGLRIEMCYPENDKFDLDLFLHKPGSTLAWYEPGVTATDPNQDSCGWHNCEAIIRGKLPNGQLMPRANWGYANSALPACENGPHGGDWKKLGFCANPRLDIDNNLSEGTGVPENINIDVPRSGETFRIMVENWTGSLAHPLVVVYCQGRRVSTYGAPPDEVPGFTGKPGSGSIGAMWRAADVTTNVDSGGNVTCNVVQLHPKGQTTGYNVTFDDGSY